MELMCLFAFVGLIVSGVFVAAVIEYLTRPHDRGEG